MSDRVVRKLVDRVDIMKDIIDNITPNYFPKESFDKNRSSIYGFIVESMAAAQEDTIVLEQRRAADYCAELSPSEIHVNQTAKLRGITVSRATPGQCYVLLGVLKSDILAKGTRVNNEVQFILDRRSTILYGDNYYSLEDDIIIRAVKRNNGYLFAANYTGEHSSYESYLQMYEHVNTHGEEIVAIICKIYQCKYNIRDQHVIDTMEFTYEGKQYDYDNRMAGFEVYYKKSSSDSYKLVPMAHYLSEEANKGLYYNDDEPNLLKILNNPNLGLGPSATIRVEIKETLGEDGNITMDETRAMSFQLYKDAAYKYAGIHVFTTMLTDTIGGSNGDTFEDLKKRLIDEKTTRKNITTEHDIITYINNIDANVQLVKKRNDLPDRSYYMYVLMRYGDRQVAPTTTKRLNLRGVYSIQDLGDFDRYDSTVYRRVVQAYSKFRLNIVDGEPDQDFVTKCSLDENEEGVFYLTCPYMILINDLNIAYYYFTSVDETAILSMKTANSLFPYQMITRGVEIYRDSHDPLNHDIYKFTVKGVLNTENDSLLVNKKTGEIEDHSRVMCHIFFPLDGNPNAYLPLEIDSYNSKTREFTFTGTIRTTDYITESDKLEIIEGLKQLTTNTNYNSVVDYKDGSFQVYFMFKQDDPENLYGRDDSVYGMLPSKYSDGYVLMNCYYNNPYNLYNLILEFSKFSRTPCQMKRVSETKYDYSLGAVPFFEYEFGREWTAKLFPTFKEMALVYGNLLKLTTDFEVSLKFIATYGDSKYVYVTGGQYPIGYEVTENLRNLTPTLYFKVYGFGAPVEEIRQMIYEYLRDTYLTDTTIYMSNVCTMIEDTFPAVNSIKFMGIDKYDGSYQEFNYKAPIFVNADIVSRYVPEHLNVTDIRIELDENEGGTVIWQP